MITFSLPSFKAIRASWFGESAPAVDLAKQWIRAHAKNSRDTVDARPAAVIYYSAFKQKGNMNTNLLLNGLLLLALTRRGAVLLV